MFFMLFLAGIAFVNLRGLQGDPGNAPLSVDWLSSAAWRPERLAEMPLDEETEMRIHFHSDGTLSGYGGCNRITGSYQVADDRLEIGPLGATRMACAEPVMSFEIAFLEALESASLVEVRDGRITLKNDNGDMLVRMVAMVGDSAP
jgi:heat shock protein HslJ